jgi:hypothetical protein
LGGGPVLFWGVGGVSGEAEGLTSVATVGAVFLGGGSCLVWGRAVGAGGRDVYGEVPTSAVTAGVGVGLWWSAVPHNPAPIPARRAVSR